MFPRDDPTDVGRRVKGPVVVRLRARVAPEDRIARLPIDGAVPILPLGRRRRKRALRPLVDDPIDVRFDEERLGPQRVGRRDVRLAQDSELHAGSDQERVDVFAAVGDPLPERRAQNLLILPRPLAPRENVVRPRKLGPDLDESRRPLFAEDRHIAIDATDAEPISFVEERTELFHPDAPGDPQRPDERDDPAPDLQLQVRDVPQPDRFAQFERERVNPLFAQLGLERRGRRARLLQRPTDLRDARVFGDDLVPDPFLHKLQIILDLFFELEQVRRLFRRELAPALFQDVVAPILELGRQELHDKFERGAQTLFGVLLVGRLGVPKPPEPIVFEPVGDLRQGRRRVERFDVLLDRRAEREPERAPDKEPGAMRRVLDGVGKRNELLVVVVFRAEELRQNDARQAGGALADDRDLVGAAIGALPLLLTAAVVLYVRRHERYGRHERAAFPAPSSARLVVRQASGADVVLGARQIALFRRVLLVRRVNVADVKIVREEPAVDLLNVRAEPPARLELETQVRDPAARTAVDERKIPLRVLVGVVQVRKEDQLRRLRLLSRRRPFRRVRSLLGVTVVRKFQNARAHPSKLAEPELDADP